MKYYHLLSLAVLGSAFVLPPQDILAEIAIDDHHEQDAESGRSWYDELLAQKDRLIEGLEETYYETEESTQDAWKSIQDTYHNSLDQAYEQAEEIYADAKEAAVDIKDWSEEAAENTMHVFDGPHDRPPPPHHGPPHHGPPHDGPPHRGPHGPHHRSNLTVYQLIAGSKYTTKLAKLINEHDDLVDALNSTKANFTVFAPTDKAFDKIPKLAPKPSKEFIKALLSYHVVPGLYPAGRVLGTHTVPTLLKSDHLGYKPHPQRIAFSIGLRGLTINHYSRIFALNIAGKNGVIHGIDSILVPPPPAIPAIDLFPGEFSTLELALTKTGLLEKLNTTDHAGGTLFAPSNFAFQKLGPRINAFLFSQYGEKYLKALLEYHVVYEHTLYSDAYIDATDDKDDKKEDEEYDEARAGYSHYDLPTLLKSRRLAVDVARYGRWITIKINAFSRVTVQDGIVADGVIQVVSNVLVPPKKVGSTDDQEESYWMGEEMSVEELIDRLEPFMPQADL